jgi:lipid II:glycine glycyltransferase (peptidoglycan interpeptide bridge formation enzyme)
VVKRDGEEIATVLFVEYHTHGYRYVRSSHGPVWMCEPDEQLEEEVVRALQDYVHKRDHKQVFLRMAIAHELSCTSPVLSTVPYDTTVVLDLTGGEEDILSRMKPRGRRDVRKSVREAPVTCADETERALESFDEYYAVYKETAERDGFALAPKEDYVRMITSLGKDHCRVFAGRLEDGTVCTWSICTTNGTRATRYYAASLSSTMRSYVTDRLCFFECCELVRLGCEEFDLMGIGSDFSPKLNGLNVFKTKFSQETIPVAPDRDVAIKGTQYRMLCLAKGAKQKIQSVRE